MVLPWLIPENGLTAAALADDVIHLIACGKRKGASYRLRQDLATGATRIPRSGTAEPFRPELEAKEFRYTNVPTLLQATPADVLRPADADPPASLDNRIRRSVTAVVQRLPRPLLEHDALVPFRYARQGDGVC